MYVRIKQKIHAPCFAQVSAYLSKRKGACCFWAAVLDQLLFIDFGNRGLFRWRCSVKSFRCKHGAKRAANSILLKILKIGKRSIGQQIARLGASGQVMQVESICAFSEACRSYALPGLTQATGLAGGYDLCT